MNFEQPRKLPKESQPGDSHIANYNDQRVDIYKLIHAAETIKEEMADITLFDSLKEDHYWHDKNGEWLGPKPILEALESLQGAPNWEVLMRDHPAWADEIKKVKNADYQTYPILVVGQNYVIDGMHRLTKAWIDGAKMIKIKRFTALPETTIVKA